MTFIRQETDGVCCTVCPGLNGARAVHGFSTRYGGVSGGIYSSLNLGHLRGDLPEAVEENWRRFAAAVGFSHTRTVFSRQEHRDLIRGVTEEDVGKGLYRERDFEADALITDVPDIPLVIFTADCIPVLLHDPEAGVVAAVHAGWRGTALGITEKTVQRMCRECGADPRRIRAAIGPGIAKCCFETTAEVPRAMTDALGPEAEEFISPGRKDHFQVDLKGLNVRWLERAGVVREHIAVSSECTACDPESYWSHRKMGNERGTMASVIMLLSHRQERI